MCSSWTGRSWSAPTSARSRPSRTGSASGRGSGGSATEVFAFRVIEAAGLDKDRDMKRERLGVAESANALKDRKIDAFFWVGGLPTAAVSDLANSPGVKIKMVDHADLVELELGAGHVLQRVDVDLVLERHHRRGDGLGADLHQVVAAAQHRLVAHPHQRGLGGDLAFVWILLNESRDRRGRLIHRFVEHAVDVGRLLHADGADGHPALGVAGHHRRFG